MIYSNSDSFVISFNVSNKWIFLSNLCKTFLSDLCMIFRFLSDLFPIGCQLLPENSIISNHITCLTSPDIFLRRVRGHSRWSLLFPDTYSFTHLGFHWVSMLSWVWQLFWALLCLWTNGFRLTDMDGYCILYIHVLLFYFIWQKIELLPLKDTLNDVS